VPKKLNVLGLAAVILTYNDTTHIERCIDSINRVASGAFVIDSGSTDDTARMATAHGAKEPPMLATDVVWLNLDRKHIFFNR